MHIVPRARVWDGVRIKSISFVLNADVNPMIADINIEQYLLARIKLITVLHGVDDDFIDKQLGAVRFIRFPVELLGSKRVGLIDQPVEP